MGWYKERHAWIPWDRAFPKVVRTSPELRHKRTDVGKHHENLQLNWRCPAISGSFRSHHNFQRDNLSCCCKSHVITYIHLSKTDSLVVHIKWKRHWNLSQITLIFFLIACKWLMPTQVITLVMWCHASNWYTHRHTETQANTQRPILALGKKMFQSIGRLFGHSLCLGQRYLR